MMKTILIAAFLNLFIMKIKCDRDLIDGGLDFDNFDNHHTHTVTHITKTACKTHYW